MRPSHACTSCGADLTYLRALPDPHYQLPIIICPACDHAVVRRRHPALAAARRYRSLRRAILTLSRRISMIALLQLAFSGAVIALAHNALTALTDTQSAPMFGHRTAFFFDEPWKDSLLSLVGVSFFLGMWLTWAFSHWRPLRILLAWAALSAFILSVDQLLSVASTLVGHAVDARWPPIGVSTREWEARLLAALLGLALAAAAGVPLGLLARRGSLARASRRFLKNLAKARAARAQTC